MIIERWNHWKQPFVMGIICAVIALLVSVIGVSEAMSMKYMETCKLKFVDSEDNYFVFKSEDGKYVYRVQNDSSMGLHNYVTKEVFKGYAGLQYFHNVNGESIFLFKLKSAFLNYLYGTVISMMATITLLGSAWMYKKGYGVKDFKGEPPNEDTGYTYFGL